MILALWAQSCSTATACKCRVHLDPLAQPEIIAAVTCVVGTPVFWGFCFQTIHRVFLGSAHPLAFGSFV